MNGLTTTVLPMIECCPVRLISLSVMLTVALPSAPAVTLPKSPTCLKCDYFGAKIITTCTNFHESITWTNCVKQRSIAVGCVPPTRYRTGGGGVSVRGEVSLDRHPPVDRQTPVKTLPCPKLRLRAVNMKMPSHHMIT